ncbi:MAG: 50S ribosomal protein L11 methyltransferase [Pseudomonadales bacterium]
MPALTDLVRRLQATLPMARLEVAPLPGCPEIRLALINADFPPGPLPGDVSAAVIARPAYWSFCWGSGLALARYLLDQPHWVRGRRVLDRGSGSGGVAIAAALAGAARVVACDNDDDALAATAANAALNGVACRTVTDLAEAGRDHDLLLMADVLYDRANLPLLTAAAGHAREVLVADSRIAELPDPAYREITTIEALTHPNLGEFDEFRTVRLFHRGPLHTG